MLRLTNISKTFNPGTEDAKLALDNVSLHVRPGDFISIIGANGAGKSTLFGAIAGSFITDTGDIILDGEDITLTPEYKRSKQIGRLFQDPMRGSAPGMTIEENLALAAGKGGWLHRLTKQEKKQLRERVALLGMGLEDRMSQPVGLLSGGQRQALTLMMATYNPPKLLLLDEHTAALDPGTAEKVLALTTKIVEENHLTCLMITHNMASALSLGNRTIMMNQGKIVLDVEGAERSALRVSDLLARFREISGKALDNDRMLLIGFFANAWFCPDHAFFVFGLVCTAVSRYTIILDKWRLQAQFWITRRKRDEKRIVGDRKNRLDPWLARRGQDSPLGRQPRVFAGI